MLNWQCLHGLQGYKEGSKIIGPLVGTVKASSVDSFAVGDWVFAHGPWRREFAARAADVMKIDTRLVREMR